MVSLALFLAFRTWNSLVILTYKTFAGLSLVNTLDRSDQWHAGFISPLWGTSSWDVSAVSLDTLAVFLLVLSLTSASIFAVWTICLVRETPGLIDVSLMIFYNLLSILTGSQSWCTRRSLCWLDHFDRGSPFHWGWRHYCTPQYKWLVRKSIRSSVAYPWAALVWLLVAVFVHGPATLHSIRTLLQSLMLQAQGYTYKQWMSN